MLVLADHGNYAGAHGLWWIGIAPFLEAYNIPLIMRWPAGINQAGRQSDELVTSADTAPNILELAGCPVADDLSGRNLTPSLRNDPPGSWRDQFCSQYSGTELYCFQRMVVTADYIYIYNGFDFDELYNLRSDLHEIVNLAQRRDMLPVIHDMTPRMWKFAE